MLLASDRRGASGPRKKSISRGRRSVCYVFFFSLPWVVLYVKLSGDGKRQSGHLTVDAHKFTLILM